MSGDSYAEIPCSSSWSWSSPESSCPPCSLISSKCMVDCPWATPEGVNANGFVADLSIVTNSAPDSICHSSSYSEVVSISLPSSSKNTAVSSSVVSSALRSTDPVKAPVSSTEITALPEPSRTSIPLTACSTCTSKAEDVKSEWSLWNNWN